MYSLENERFKISFEVLKGQRELPCMSPEGRAGTRKGQSLLRHSCPHIGQAGLVLEECAPCLWECASRSWSPSRYAVEGMPALREDGWVTGCARRQAVE